MAGSLFQRCWFAGLGLIAAAANFWLVRHWTSLEVERWFLPGAIGREARSGSGLSGGRYSLLGSGGPAANNQEPITSNQPLIARGFLTRATSGVDAEWGRVNNLTKPLAFSHHLGAVFPPELYPQHPDFFPLVEGRRLQPLPGGTLFWNPDVGRADVALYAAEAARRHFAAHPEQGSFSLGVNDAQVFGESPELLTLTTPQRWFRERPDYSNLVFTFMNRAADELSRTHPDKYLGALAYYWAENAPDFPLHSQVVPFLTADRSQGYDPKFWQEEMELQERWARVANATPLLGKGYQLSGAAQQLSGASQLSVQSSGLSGSDTNNRDRVTDNEHPTTNNQSPVTNNPQPPPRRLGLYDYLYGGGFLIPRIHTKLLAENLRHARRVGFTDYYAEVYPNWGLDGPMPWLMAQLLQDPEQSAEALLDEYYRRYFKETAEPMRRFFELCEKQWMGQPGPSYWLKHYRNESQAIIFPSPVCGQLRALLDGALTRASSETVRQRVNLVSQAFGVTERFVRFNEARDQATRLALTSGVDWKAALSALREYVAARRDFIRYTTDLRQTEPLAVRMFGWDDYLKNDPVAEVLFVIQTAARAKGEEADANTALNSWSETSVNELWSSVTAASTRPEKELLRNGTFSAPPQPARRIAGLEYGVALPAEWVSRVEPAEFHRAELLGAGNERRLRISGSKDTTVSQWNRVDGSGLHRASISVRGHVSPGTIVNLTFAWLDGHEKHVGFKALRLPDGEWPDWVTLEQAGPPPPGAVWVGMGLHLQNQVAGDWIEVKDFHLLATD